MTIARTPVITPDTTTKRNRQNSPLLRPSSWRGVAVLCGRPPGPAGNAPSLFEASFPLGRLTMRLRRVLLSTGLICGLAIGYVVSFDRASGTLAKDRQLVPVGKSSYLVATRYHQRGRTERFFERSTTAKQFLCPTQHPGVCRTPKPHGTGKPPIPIRSAGSGSTQR